MTQYINIRQQQGCATPEDAGVIVDNHQVFDMSRTDYAPSVINNTDQIQVGIVPAGFVLVTRLSKLTVPILDSNGAPTGTFEVGTALTPAALVAAATAAGTAHTFYPPGCSTPLLDNGQIGSIDTDIPIFLTFGANVATPAVTGQIIFAMAIRPYNTAFDGATI